MCLILLAYRAHPDADLILGGNRDEFYARPSAPPERIATVPRIEAGRDLEAGGTWFGRNEHGLLAALTNRRAGDGPPDARSRGLIVRTLLARPDADAAAEWLAAQDIARYRPFSVLFGTAARFYYAASDEGGRPRELAPGYYALSNAALNDTSWPKVARALAFWQRAHALDGESLLRALQAFLCDPTPPDDEAPTAPGEQAHGALGAVFIRTPGYGTVSSSILTAGGRLGGRYYYADAEDMGDAQAGWARGAMGNGTGRGRTNGSGNGAATGHGEGGNPGAVYVPPPEGSPYRRLTFGE